MSDILSGLEELGLGKVSNIDVYGNGTGSKEEAEKKDSTGNNDKDIMGESGVSEADMIFEKNYSCPCCYKEIKSRRVRTGKARSLKSDSDLRPRHKNIDTVKYDIVACPYCGYASLESSFSNLSQVQIKWIREKISENFSGITYSGDTYTYDEAILRTKLAILCTVVKSGKDSEKAFTCLKLAWLYRGKMEALDQDQASVNKLIIDELEKGEFDNLSLAYDGFTAAYSNETFPILGMNESAYLYLMAELARRIGKIEDSKRLISRLLQKKDVSRNVKDLVYELREKLK